MCYEERTVYVHNSKNAKNDFLKINGLCIPRVCIRVQNQKIVENYIHLVSKYSKLGIRTVCLYSSCTVGIYLLVFTSIYIMHNTDNHDKTVFTDLRLETTELKFKRRSTCTPCLMLTRDHKPVYLLILLFRLGRCSCLL